MDALFPPGPQKSLLLGDAPQFKQNPLEALLRAAHTYGSFVHFRFGPSHAYLLTNPRDAHFVLVERFDLFAEKQSLFRTLNSAMGHDLFAPDDTVSRKKLRRGLFKTQWLDALIDDAAQICACTEWHGGDPLEALKPLTRRLVTRLLFGDAEGRLDPLIERLERVIYADRDDRCFQSPLTLPLWVPTAPNRRRQAALAELRHVVSAIVADHRARGRYSALSCLLNAADDEQQACAEMLALFFAGSEAAAHTLAWTWYLLAQHPEAAENLEAEVDSVLGGRTPTTTDPLPYTDMILNETLRLYPPVWLISRQAKGETRIGEYYVPSGSTIFVSPYITHRSPRCFTSPDKFVPERFGDTWARRSSTHAYMPFGAGTYAAVEHNFLMTIARLVLATTAQRIRPTLTSDQPVIVEPGLSLRPNGLKLNMQQRTPIFA